MNKIYKVIWSRVRHCYVVVSELAKRAGKEKSTCLSTAGKTVAVLGLGAVLFMGSPCSEAFAATGKVTGGASTNQATGENATVSGGEKNKAEGKNSSVSGGGDNEAVGESSSISGGMQNKATGKHSSVTGGTQNQAGGQFATVSGGSGNKAFGADSVVIGGTGNITGKVAVDKNGDPLLDANGNEYAADASNPFPIYGVGSVAIGGYSSTIQGNYSVGIAGGSTSAGAASAVAAGNQATVTVANGVAIGYEATASVIDSSRAADTEGRIVSFGHKKGDVYYTVQYQNHTVTENTYDSDAYNRLVNVADGIDDHDVVVMEQLTKAKAEAVATAKNQIKVKGDETNVHAEETTDQDGVQTTTISLKPKVTLKDRTDTTGAKQVVLDGTAGTISAGLSTDTGNFISLDGTQGLAKVGAIQIGNQSFTYDYMKPGSLNDDGATLKLESVRASASGNFVTGLSNRTWTPGNYVTGRAATEDQLEQAGRHFLSIKTAYKDDDGNSITPVAENSLANYYNDGASGSASMAFGVGTTAAGDHSLSMGVRSSASGLNSLAIGYDNTASGTQSVAVGNGTNASGNFSVAMGLGSQAGTQNTDPESTDNGAAVAVGFEASAEQTGSAAYGYMASANNFESSAFGTSAAANADGSVALGAHSVANRDKGISGYLAPTSLTPDNAAIWISTDGAVSLGGKTKNDAGQDVTISRQITNLAAGTEDSDAVNVAQLKAVETKGMNFQGNDTATSVHVDQGGTLQIQGSGRKEDREYSTQNIKVLTDTANNRLSISLDKNPVFDSVTAGTERNSADGGQAGSLKIVGADSSSTNKATTITAGYVDTPELSGTTGTGRLSYTDGDGAAHTVATLGDGLKLAGDTGTGSVALDKTLDVKGGATDLATGNNIGVTVNGSTLSLKLARDITGLDTVTAGGAKLGTQTDGNNPAQSGDYLTGLDNTTWTVGQTQPVTGRAATEDQLKSVSDVVNTNKTNIANNTEAIGRGLNFQANTKGNDGSYKTVNRALGSTVAVRAGDAQNGHTYKTDNLTTEIDDNGIITVKMDTQLTADKVTVRTGDKTITVDGNSGNVTTGASTLGSTGLTITNGPSVTTSGISGGSKQIFDVASGKSGDDESGNPVYGIETNAANIGDVKKIAAKTVTVSGDGKNTNVVGTPNTTDGTVDYQVSLNDSVTLGSDADKKVALDGTAGTVSVGDKVTLNGNTGTATIGGATLGNSGADTYLTGLTNKTWDGTAVSGRAATEDQLQSVSDTVNTGWNAKVGDQTLAVTPANNTLTFAAGDNIALTPTDSSKTITIATQPNVTFTTVRVGSTDGTDGIYIGSQPGGGANGSATSNITSITGLKNTAWVTDHFMSGRAATEDQLNEVAKTIKGEASASDIYVESGSVSYGNNGEGTGTLVRKNDKTTGQLTGLHDYYVTGGSVSTDGKTLNLTKNGGDAIPGIDMTNVLNQDSHLVAADSGEYTVGSDGKVTLKVKNNAEGSTPTDVVISGIASNAALQKGLNFEANGAEKEDGSAAYNAQLGDKISVLGGAAKDKHTYNTDNITTTMDNGTITVKLDDDLTAHSLTAGSSTVNGTVRVTGTGGAYIEMDGSDGSLHMGNNGGRYSALYQDYGGASFLNSADSSPRLKYDVDTAKGTYHTIATLEDGLKFAGDDAKTDTTKAVSTTLNSTLNITGGAAVGKLTDGNIGVVKNGDDGLAIKLNKDLTNMGTISFAPTETGKAGIKIGSQTIANNGTSPNDAAGDYITGLTNTKWSKDGIVSGRAATEDQLQQVAKSIVDGKETGGGFGLSDNAGNVVKQDLGGSIQLKAADDNLTTTADTTGKAITIGLSKELKDMISATFKDATTGAMTVIDGKGIAITPQNGSTNGQVKLTTDGLSNGGKQITNVQSGLYDTAQNKPVDISTITAGSPMLQNGATIGDLQTVSNGVKTELTDKGLNFKGNDATTTVHRNLGDTLTIQGTGADGRDYDGGANVQVKADKNANTLTVQLDRDLNAHTLTLGKASTGTGTGEAGKLILNGTNKDNGMSPVSIGVTYRGNQDKEAMKTAMSRITYKGGNGNDHTVATLEDGLQLAGDNGEALNTTLDKKVTIKGGVAKDKLVDNTTDPTKNNNIGVVASQDKDGNTTLSLQLAKDITGLNTVTAGTVVMGNQSVVSDGKVTETGNFVAGLENTDWDGKDYVSGRAATEDQLKKVNDSITKVLGNGTFAITAGGRGEAVDATIEQNLGSAIRIFGDAPVTNEKNDGSGDFWDRSKANILTKVKKDHDGNDYVSVELQDHLDVGVHGDGKTIEGTDGSMQFKGKSAKEVNITGDTGITLSDNGKKAAALRQADGAGYLDLTGTAGTQATVSVHTVAKNLAQQDQTRLTYTDQGNKAHEVATLEDGLIFAGDTDDNVSRTLNGTLKIYGGADVNSLSDGKNIGVVASSDGLQLKLAKNLTGIESITGLTNTTITSADFATKGRAATEEQLKQAMSSVTTVTSGGGFGLTDNKGNAVKADLGNTIGVHGDSNITTSVSDDGKSINIKLKNQVNLGDEGSITAGGVTISKDGINAGNKQIKDVASGIGNVYDTTKEGQENWNNAANIGDVKKLAGEAAQGAVDSLGTRDFTGDDGEKISRKLGETMKLSGGADTAKLTDKNIGVVKNANGDGLDIKLSKELTGLTSVTTGNSTLNNDGLTINSSTGAAGTTLTSSGIRIAANGEGTHNVEISSSNVSMGGQQIHDVAPGTAPTDAVNVSQLGGVVSGVNNAITRLDSRVDRVGAGASALAALHPLEFDPEDKLNFAAGFGHYRSANAAAIGAFYQPTESVRFNVGGSFGGGENMVNAGVTFSLDPKRRDRFQSRIVLMRTVQQLRSDNETLRQDNQKVHAQLDAMNDRLNKLTALVEQLSAKQ